MGWVSATCHASFLGNSTKVIPSIFLSKVQHLCWDSAFSVQQRDRINISICEVKIEKSSGNGGWSQECTLSSLRLLSAKLSLTFSSGFVDFNEATLHSCLFVFLPLIDCVKKNAIFKLVLVQILLLISNKIVKPDSFLWLSNKKRKNNWVKTWKSNYPFKIYQFHCLFPLSLLPLHPIIEIKTLDTGRCIVLVHVLLFSFCMSSSL